MEESWANTRVVGRFLRTGEIGVFGYILGFIQFIGFLLGGVAAYLLLSEGKMCPSCNLYLSSLLTRERSFPDMLSAIQYVVSFGDVVAPQASKDQVSIDTSDNTALASLQPIQTRVTFKVLGCPMCKRQILEQKIAADVNGEWKDIDSLTRSFELPFGADVRSRVE